MDEKAVKVHPLSVSLLPGGFSEVFRFASGKKIAIRSTDSDLLEISMFGCNGLERHNNPFGVQYLALEYHVFEPRRLG